MSFPFRIIAIGVAASMAIPCYAQQPHHSPGEQFLADEWKIWSSPARIRPKDAFWLGGLAAGSALLFRTDRKVSGEVAESNQWMRPSHTISSLGGGVSMVAAPATLLVIGKLSSHHEITKTGALSLAAVAHAGLVAQSMKLIAGRQRPTENGGQGMFEKGGSSFPSGHSMTSWAFATVIARRTHNRWIQFGSYSFATAVAMSRIGGRNHFPSDVLLGSAGGYWIGRYLTRP